MMDISNFLCVDTADGASPLSRYIYLNSWGASEKAEFVATCRKNFLVYIVTIEMDCDEPTTPKPQETHSKINLDQFERIDTQSEKSSSCRTKIGAKRRRVQESSSKLYRFIKKIIPSKTSRTKCTTSSFDEMFLRDYNYTEENLCLEGCSKGGLLTQYMAPISYIEHNFIGECTNAETLREINDLGGRIEQSETAIKELILKYLQDTSIERELTQTVTSHNKLLGEIERRTGNLSSEHWMQQVEVYKEQQRNLQTTMNSIVHQNRELLEENELLSKKNEKLSAAIMVLKEGNMSPMPKSPSISSRMIMDDLGKNNDRLRGKINTLMAQVGDMEEALKKLTKRNQFLQQQLNASSTHLYHNKILHDKSKNEHELHTAKLMNELQANGSILKECAENGSLIMQDLEVLKMQLAPMAKVINWDKFQKSARTLPEIIQLNRACINDLGSELVHKSHELGTAHSEIENLKMTNSNIKPLRDEIHDLRSRLEDASNLGHEHEAEIKRLKENLCSGEERLTSMTALVSSKDNDLETKEKIIKEREEEIRNFHEALTNAKSDFSQLQFASDKLRHENNALLLQVKGMAQVLTATGAGDIAKELANTQEKLTAVQTQYFAIAAENSILLKQIETNKSERQTLVAYQKSCYEQLQVLHKDIESLEKANETLKEVLETEKKTVTALQNERVRHLEERTILTAIYERLKSEVSKVDQLEGAVSTMNKKASKLALIAEYNKQLGEKLQNEVAERDVAINELQNNVKQLNCFQLESTKEKEALCDELNKVFSVKEVLNTKLTAELEKNVILDESKKEIQNCANLQLKEIQAAYNREHQALKNLVKDVKQLVTERDCLMEANKAAEAKCVNMLIEQDKLVDFIKSLQASVKEKEEKYANLEEVVTKRNSDLDTLKKVSEDDMCFLRGKFDVVTGQIDAVTKDNDALKTSLEYLQTDLTKTRKELDAARQSEQDLQKRVEDMRDKYEALMHDYQVKANALHESLMENEELKMNVYSLGEKFKCLTEDNERMSQDTMRLETMLAEKFQTSKMSGRATPKHVENVLDDINARDEEILILQDRIREFEERGMELNDLLQTISDNRDAFELRNKQLQEEVDSMLQEMRSGRHREEELECIIQELQTRRISVEDFEEQQNQFNATIEQLKNEYSVQFQALAHQLNEIDKQKQQQQTTLEETAKNLNTYKEAHEKLQKAHKVLALKLFTAVRVLICEKVSLENAQTKIKSFADDREEHLKYREQKENEIQAYQTEIAIFKTQLCGTRDDNEVFARDLKAAKELIEQLEARLEEQFKESSSRGDMQETLKDQEFHIATIKSQLEESRRHTDGLQQVIATLEASCACIEFEKSEAVLHLHELHSQTQTEISRNDGMKRAMQTTLGLIIEMKETGLITPYVHNQLLQSFHEHV